MFKLYKGFFKINMSAVFVEAVIRTEEFCFLFCQSQHRETKAPF